MADKQIDVMIEKIKNIFFIVSTFIAILLAINYLISRISRFLGVEDLSTANVFFILMSIRVGIGIIYGSYLILYGKLVSRSTHNRLVNRYKDRFGGVLLVFFRRG